MSRISYVQDPKTLKLVPKDEYYASESENKANYAIHGEIEPFISPVDGTLIDDRAKLRAHNKRNNVENVADADVSYMKQRYQEGKRAQARRDKEDRQNILKNLLNL